MCKSLCVVCALHMFYVLLLLHLMLPYQHHVTQFFQLLKQQLGAKEWEKSLPPAQKQPQVSTVYC